MPLDPQSELASVGTSDPVDNPDWAGAEFADAPPGQVVQPCPARAATEADWIAIEVLDDFGRDVAGEPFEVSLPDGTKRTGKLNASGRARVDGIPAGKCQVRFPQRDDLWWQPTPPPAPPALIPSSLETPARATATGPSWIEFQIRDESGKPVPLEPFVALLPDGTTQVGRLDAGGFCRLEGVAAGKAKITFPERDPAWFAAPAAPEPPPLEARTLEQ
jgi:hypothetical protein